MNLHLPLSGQRLASLKNGMNQRAFMWYRRAMLGLLLTFIMVLGTINPAQLLLDERPSEIDRANGEEINFNGQGYLLNKVDRNTTTNEMELQRPEITWAPTTGGGLMITRAHGCMAHDTTNELVYLMGGRTDPDPQQSNDEAATNLIEIWNQSCLLYTSPSPRDRTRSRMPSSA